MCVGKQIICAYALENRSSLVNMIIIIGTAIPSTAMDKHVIEVRLCIASMRSAQLRHDTIESSREFDNPCSIKSQSQSIPLEVLIDVSDLLHTNTSRPSDQGVCQIHRE